MLSQGTARVDNEQNYFQQGLLLMGTEHVDETPLVLRFHLWV